MYSSALPPPPDDTRGPQLLIVSWVTLSLGLIIVTLRFITRGVLRRTLGRDDWTILIALVSNLPSLPTSKMIQLIPLIRLLPLARASSLYS